MRPRLALAFLALLFAVVASAADDALPSVAAKLAGSEPHEGFLTLHFDRERGKLWLVVPPPDVGGVALELLYIDGLTTGLGSNPVGLDRGQLGDSRVVRLRRVGGKFLLEQVNLDFRAQSESAAERRAVAQSFASSVLWAAPIAALDPDGRAVVDFTSFVQRDAHGIATTLDAAEQGSFQLDQDRSAVDFDACLVFPDNVELEAVLTFTGVRAGPEVVAVAPHAGAITMLQHHSLMRLPAPGYRPLPHDPRAGSLGIRVRDYALPLDRELDRWLAIRHRLVPGKPITYYVDQGVPEPVRSALLAGAGWWRQAFARAGRPGMFEVALLPEGVHPLDIRYNVIQWVHRATRGWSYGGGVVDPLTGERLKGQVSLGSLRVRHDRMLFEGLLGAERTGSGDPGDPVVLALRRIRQLAAHEVGHTLGLAHNFAGSTFDRGSVMDYPAPWIRVDAAGRLDPSEAYGEGVGAWDDLAIAALYGELGAGDPAQAIAARVDAGAKRGLVFLSDTDARGNGAANARASLWDNGSDPITELQLTMRVRAIALASFGERNLRAGLPLGRLRDTLAPLYFHHRYQLEATAKLVGGLDYLYGVSGGTPPARVRAVAGERQRAALAAMLEALEPSVLDLNDDLLAVLLPTPFALDAREQISGDTDPAFDPLAAARTAAGLVAEAVLLPSRAARLVEQHRRDSGMPGLEEVIEALLEAAATRADLSERRAEIARVIRATVIEAILRLGSNPAAPAQVRSRVEERLRRLRAELVLSPLALDGYLANSVARFLHRTVDPAPTAAPHPPPPGSPIGDDGSECGWVGR